MQTAVISIFFQRNITKKKKTKKKKRVREDSNPRYLCRHAGFQDRFLQPLRHSPLFFEQRKKKHSFFFLEKEKEKTLFSFFFVLCNKNTLSHY